LRAARFCTKRPIWDPVLRSNLLPLRYCLPSVLQPSPLHDHPNQFLSVPKGLWVAFIRHSRLVKDLMLRLESFSMRKPARLHRHWCSRDSRPSRPPPRPQQQQQLVHTDQPVSLAAPRFSLLFSVHDNSPRPTTPHPVLLQLQHGRDRIELNLAHRHIM